MKISSITTVVASLLMLVAMAFPTFAQQPTQPGTRANLMTIVDSATTTGNKAAVRGVNTNKTYEFVGSTTAGTGTAVIGIQGSNLQSSWSTIATTSLTLGTVTTSATAAGTDRWVWLRAVVTTLTGTGASVSITAGY